MAAAFVVGFNTTDAPIVIDADGRSLGGYEWGAVRAATQIVRAHVDGGRLVLHPELEAGKVPDDADPAVAAAADRAAELRARAEAASALEPEVRIRLATAAGILPEDRDANADPVPDLEVALAYSSVDIPNARRRGPSA